ncbi:MAG: DUF3047 domain-containing protein [Candidatus Binatia bacterium]
MGLQLIVIPVCLWFLLLLSQVQAEDLVPTSEGIVHLETFDEYQLLSFPTRWKVRGDEDVAKAVYQIAEEDGNRFLHAHAEQHDVQIGLSRSFAADKFPILQWRWRVKQLPTGADERAVKTNDSAAGVYVVYDNRIMPRAIKYVWSASLPVGTRMTSPVYWRAKVVVLKSGEPHLGEWQQETVNLYQDYKDLFDAEPGEVQGIAVLTDSDITKSTAEADYDDFTLLTVEAVRAKKAKTSAVQLAPAVTGNQ